MPLNVDAKNTILTDAAALFQLIRLHTADPGAGALNPTTAGGMTPTWATPSGGELALATDLLFTGGAPNGPVTWFTVWNAAGTVRRGKGRITVGATAFNGAGEFTLTTATRLRLLDPAVP